MRSTLKSRNDGQLPGSDKTSFSRTIGVNKLAIITHLTFYFFKIRASLVGILHGAVHLFKGF
jgi:hypothetical protein